MLYIGIKEILRKIEVRKAPSILIIVFRDMAGGGTLTSTLCLSTASATGFPYQVSKIQYDVTCCSSTDFPLPRMFTWIILSK